MATATEVATPAKSSELITKPEQKFTIERFSVSDDGWYVWDGSEIVGILYGKIHATKAEGR